MGSLNISRIFLKISQGFLYLVLLTPLLISRNLYFPFVSGKIIFFKVVVELALFFYLLAFFTNPKQPEFEFKKYFKNPIFLSVGVFCLIFFFASFWGINAKFSLFSNYERGDGGFQFLHYLVFFFLLVSLFRTKNDWKRFFFVSIIVSLIVCFYALGQLGEAKCLVNAASNESAIQACSSGTFLAASLRVSGTLGNSSYLAVYILFHFLFIGYLFIGEKIKALKFVWGAIAVFEFYILLLTQTRGVFLGLLVAILLWVLLSIFRLIRREDKRILYIIGVVLTTLALFLVILSFFSSGHPNSVAARFVKSLDPSYVMDSLKDRFWAWSSATAAIVEKPFGWGAENFPQAFDKYYNPKLFGVESWFDRAHNIYLDYALVGGFPLLLVFLSICFFCFRQLFRMFLFSHSDKDEEIKSYFLYSILFIVITTYLVQGLVLFDVVSTYLVLFILLAFAIFLLSPIPPTPLPKPSLPSQSLLFPRIISGLLIISIPFGLYWLGFLPYQRGQFLIKALNQSQSEFIDAIKTEQTDFNKTFQNIISYIEPVIRHQSPVGESESFLSFIQMSEDFSNYLSKNEISITKNSFAPFVDYINDEFNREEKNNSLIGTRPLLTMGWLNFNAGRITKNDSYYEKTAEYFNKGLKASATRMEFILAKLELSFARKDKETANKMLNSAAGFRPDLKQTNEYYQQIYKEKFGEVWESNSGDQPPHQ